jgi:hypothetical protein
MATNYFDNNSRHRRIICKYSMSVAARSVDATRSAVLEITENLPRSDRCGVRDGVQQE